MKSIFKNDNTVKALFGERAYWALKELIDPCCNNGKTKHYIGEEFGGGVIFHLWFDENGVEHGLIVDKVELSTGIKWSNITNQLSGANGWDGLSNSNIIVNQPGHTTSAASLCLNSTNSGYNDWYLPSLNEMLLLINNAFNVNRTMSLSGGTQIRIYWTSNEVNATIAYLGPAYNGGVPKSNSIPVRAIRSF